MWLRGLECTINGNAAEVHDLDLRDPNQLQKFVDHSCFRYADESEGLNPWDGETDPHYVLGLNTVGTRTHIQAIDEGAKHSWIKAPRWRGHAIVIGPLTRYIIGYAKGIPEFKEPVKKVLTDLQLPLPALFATLVRIPPGPGGVLGGV